MGVFRIDPQGRPADYKTYAIRAPLETHFRSASCEEVECEISLMGWETHADESTDLGQRQAHYIRRLSGRSFTEARDQFGITVFSFPSGQECFKDHQVAVGRPEIYLVRPGDWRTPGARGRVHDRPEHWVEDFSEHQDKVKDQIEKGKG